MNVFVDSGGNGGGAIDHYGITFRGGDLYVASFFANEVKRFNGTTGAFVSTFVTSYNDDSIRRYSGTTGAFLSIFVTAGSGGLDGPIDFGFQPTAPGLPAVSTLYSVCLSVLIAALILAGSLRARRGAFSGAASA